MSKTSHSLFTDVNTNLEKFSSIEELRKVLQDNGCYNIFSEILNSDLTAKLMTCSISYIVLAFSHDSTWLKFSMPYNDMLLNIKESILDIAFKEHKQSMLEDDKYSFCTSELNLEFVTARSRYINWQRDSDFRDLMVKIIHRENLNIRILNAKNANARDFVNEAKAFMEIDKLADSIEALSVKVKNKYMNLNQILESQNLKKIDEDTAESFLEQYIKE